MWYVDTSAFVKLIVQHAESGAMSAWARAEWSGDEGLSSSDLLRTEALRVARRVGSDVLARTRTVLDALALVDTFHAGEIGPAVVRSLDGDPPGGRARVRRRARRHRHLRRPDA